MKIICHHCHHAVDAHSSPTASRERYTIRGMIMDLAFSVVHVEKKGLVHTIRALTMEPGKAISAFIRREGSGLYQPFKYLLLVGAVIIICSLRYKFFHNEHTQFENHQLQQWITLDAAYWQYLNDFFQFAENQATLLNIMAIPIFAFFSWSFLSDKKFNYAENLIINTFITGQQLLFLLLLIPILEIFPGSREAVIPIYFLGILAYNVWVYWQIFPGRRIPIFFQSLLAVLLAYVYQLPFNLMLFFFYEHVVHSNEIVKSVLSH